MPKVAQFKDRVRAAFLLRGELTSKQMSDLAGGGYPADVAYQLRKCGLNMKIVRRENGVAIFKLTEAERGQP